MRKRTPMEIDDVKHRLWKNLIRTVLLRDKGYRHFGAFQSSTLQSTATTRPLVECLMPRLTIMPTCAFSLIDARRSLGTSLDKRLRTLPLAPAVDDRPDAYARDTD